MGRRFLELVAVLLVAFSSNACPANKGAPTGNTDQRVDDDAAPYDAASMQAHVERPAEVEAWATWPIPNGPSSGLPNPQKYDLGVAGVVLDLVTGLMWQRTAASRAMTFGEARSACDELTLGGYDDWRLPSRIELVSIVDLSRSQPTINLSAFPSTPSDWFWTSSAASDDRAAAWYVYFYFGYPKVDDKSNRFAVRCVRTATIREAGPPATHYELQADEVHDVATGLTWQRAVPAKTFTFEGARTYCGQLVSGRRGGWRVPSMAELLSLIDERAAGPTIDAAAFPNTPSESFWTSSLFADSHAMAWHVYFDHGNALYGLVRAQYRVRCVR